MATAFVRRSTKCASRTVAIIDTDREIDKVPCQTYLGYVCPSASRGIPLIDKLDVDVQFVAAVREALGLAG